MADLASDGEKPAEPLPANGSDEKPSNGPVSAPATAGDQQDAWYALGSRFLQLPARATRDGDAERGEAPTPVGTAVHVELFAPAGASAPPYLAIAFEPATGEVISCRRVDCTTGFDGYEEVPPTAPR